MENRILASTKKSLGIMEDQTAFDDEVLMHINSAISTLTQLGVGPPDGLTVDDTTTWDALISENAKLNSAKTYVQMQTKMSFDPPDIGFVITAMKQRLEELEWRLNVVVDTPEDVPEPTEEPEDEFLDVEVIDSGYIY